jgi:hypothetical protein
MMPRWFRVNGVQNARFTGSFTTRFTSMLNLPSTERDRCARRNESFCT